MAKQENVTLQLAIVETPQVAVSYPMGRWRSEDDVEVDARDIALDIIKEFESGRSFAYPEDFVIKIINKPTDEQKP